MQDGDSEPLRQAAADEVPSGSGAEDQDGDGGAFAAICAVEQPDCDDTLDAPLGGFAPYRCLPEAVDCVDTYSCMTTLPAPIDDPALVDPAVAGPAVDDLPLADVDVDGGAEPAPAPELSPEEQAKLEDSRAREIAICTEPEPCVLGPAVDCGPIDECVPGPAVDCGPVDCVVGPADECLPLDCAISSDGEIACPQGEPCILPAPDLPVETIIERCAAGCTSPGFEPGAQESDPATDTAVGAPEGTLPCLVDPPVGGGTDGAPPGSTGVVEPTQVE
jgi:hypothetical protein